MKINEFVGIARVVISTGLLVTAGWMATHNSDGWGWFLFVGVLVFPSQINVDFREKDEQSQTK